MKTEESMNRICPVCGREYNEVPAISRVDNTTLICPDCGVREALCNIGVGEAEREEIIGIIHRVGRERRCK